MRVEVIMELYLVFIVSEHFQTSAPIISIQDLAGINIIFMPLHYTMYFLTLKSHNSIHNSSVTYNGITR